MPCALMFGDLVMRFYNLYLLSLTWLYDGINKKDCIYKQCKGSIYPIFKLISLQQPNWMFFSSYCRSFMFELSNLIRGSTDDTVVELYNRHDIACDMDLPEEEMWFVQAPLRPQIHIQEPEPGN